MAILVLDDYLTITIYIYIFKYMVGYIYIPSGYIYIFLNTWLILYIYNLWLFNIAMGNGPLK